MEKLAVSLIVISAYSNSSIVQEIAVQLEYIVGDLNVKIDGMIRSPNDGVHLETPQAQTHISCGCRGGEGKDRSGTVGAS